MNVSVRVTNTGTRAEKEVVQLYYRAPWGLLQKPMRALAAFCKTGLLSPGESETVHLTFPVSDMASFDDLGKIAPSAWVLEKGRYALYVGTSVRDGLELDWGWDQGETEIVRTVSDSLAPSRLAKRLLADGSWKELLAAPAVDTDANLLQPIHGGSAEAVAPAEPGRERWRLTHPFAEGVQPLSAVAEGKLTLEGFMAQLSDSDLIHLLGGQPNVGVFNTFGLGNLPACGAPNLTTADGPAGLRIRPEVGVCTTAWPCATLVAATWDRSWCPRWAPPRRSRRTTSPSGWRRRSTFIEIPSAAGTLSTTPRAPCSPASWRTPWCGGFSPGRLPPRSNTSPATTRRPTGNTAILACPSGRSGKSTCAPLRSSSGRRSPRPS